MTWLWGFLLIYSFIVSFAASVILWWIIWDFRLTSKERTDRVLVTLRSNLTLDKTISLRGIEEFDRQRIFYWLQEHQMIYEYQEIYYPILLASFNFFYIKNILQVQGQPKPKMGKILKFPK